MKLNCNLVLNNLSFGACSYNILKELYKKGVAVNLFPIANNIDLSGYNNTSKEFIDWLQKSINTSLSNLNKDIPTFKLWHIKGSHEQIGSKQYLFTFHETDTLTPVEVNILNQQEKVFVSSEESKRIFEESGVTVPVVYIPLGFDSDHYSVLNKKYYSSEITVWSIFGKSEMRKATVETINLWAKKYGNNKSHVLHLAVNNPFFKPEENAALIDKALEGKKYFNINSLPYVKTLAEYNELLNCTDIVIDMSRGEGFSMPSFTALALGKHGIVHNCSAMKGWANEKNAILVEPCGKIKAIDNIFFSGTGDFNIGNFYNWDAQDLLNAFDKALERKNASKINNEGLKLQSDFSWSRTVDSIIKEINLT